MENARWNGQLLIASEIAKDYSLEKEIRKASGHKELRCPDPECQNPILRYCHGEKKDAFFAHLNNEHCDYADFDRENTQIMRTVRRTIYEQFKNKGFQVYPEVKILDHHYTHLLIDMDEGNKIAIEIGTQRITANRIDALTDAYRKKGIAVKWIVIDNTDFNVRESQTYFLKRYLFNESKNKDLLVVAWDGKEVAQYKVDPNQYEYNGRIFTSSNYPETYFEHAPIEELTIDSEELTLAGYNERYEKWLLRKRSAFEKRIMQLEEENKRRMEELQRQEKEIREQQLLSRSYQQKLYVANTTASLNPVDSVSTKHESPNRAYNQCEEEILSLIEQQDTPAFDSMGRRWIKCEKCGCIGTDAIFISYGGENHVNLGICYNCSGSKRPINI